MDIIEIIGYAASVIVAISLTMSKILRLRILNLLGAFTFIVYGYFSGAYPIFAVNLFIVFINIYYLVKMYRNKDKFDILEDNSSSIYVRRFYEYYESDIKKFFNNFSFDDISKSKTLFILRDMRPVNLVIYNEQPNGIVEIILDYTIPEYRDMLNGRYLIELFNQGQVTNCSQLVTKVSSLEHEKYLKKIGFRKNNMGLYVIKVK